MLTFAMKSRLADDTPPLWLTDADVAMLLNINRATVWRWLDAGHLPQPRRIGKANRTDGRRQACATRWHREDIELFAQCTGMSDYRKRKSQQQR